MAKDETIESIGVLTRLVRRARGRLVLMEKKRDAAITAIENTTAQIVDLERQLAEAKATVKAEP